MLSITTAKHPYGILKKNLYNLNKAKISIRHNGTYSTQLVMA